MNEQIEPKLISRKTHNLMNNKFRNSTVAVMAALTVSLTSFSAVAIAQDSKDSKEEIVDNLTIVGNFPDKGEKVKKENPGADIIVTSGGYSEAVEKVASHDDLKENVLIHVGDNDKIGKKATQKLVDVANDGHSIVILARENSESYKALMRAKDDLDPIKIATHKEGRINTDKDSDPNEELSDTASSATGKFVDKNTEYWDKHKERDKELDAYEEELNKRREAMRNGSGGSSSSSSGSSSSDDSLVDSRSEEGKDQDTLDENEGAGNDDANWQELKTTLQGIADKAKEEGIDMGIAAGPVSADGVGISAGSAGDKMYSASTIKIPIAVAVQKNLDSNEQVEVTEVVGGTGGAIQAGSYPVSQLLKEMITNSDNTATNALIEALGGFGKVNDAIKEAKGSDVALSNMMMDGKNTSTVTANGSVNILQSIWRASVGKGDLLEKDKAQEIIDLMKQQKHTNKLPSKINEPGMSVANKTGENTGVSHDIGYIIIDDNGRDKAVAVAVTTQFDNDGLAEKSNGMVGDVGKAVADWFKNM